MKVKQIKTGKVISVNDSYGIRLIEQGQAVPVKEKAKASTGDKPKREKGSDVSG